MGRWRCPARVTALLLCKGWQEGDAEKEEEQLLLAGDVQVNFEVAHCCAIFLGIVSTQKSKYQYQRDHLVGQSTN